VTGGLEAAPPLPDPGRRLANHSGAATENAEGTLNVLSPSIRSAFDVERHDGSSRKSTKRARRLLASRLTARLVSGMSGSPLKVAEVLEQVDGAERQRGKVGNTRVSEARSGPVR